MASVTCLQQNKQMRSDKLYNAEKLSSKVLSISINITVIFLSYELKFKFKLIRC